MLRFLVAELCVLMKSSALNRIAENIQKLLNGEEVDLYESLVDTSFEYISAEILSPQLEDGIWYDGTDDLVFEKVGANQFTSSQILTYE